MRIVQHCPLCLGPTYLNGPCAFCQQSINRDCQDTNLTALGPFEGTLRACVLRIKHQGDTALARWAGDQLARRLRTAAPPDAVTYIPSQMHNRWRRRGDSAATVAQQIADRISRPCLATLRPRFSIHGKQRTAQQRQQHSSHRVIQQSALTLWLVDDVSASGATLASASDSLTQAGYWVTQRIVIAAG